MTCNDWSNIGKLLTIITTGVIVGNMFMRIYNLTCGIKELLDNKEKTGNQLFELRLRIMDLENNHLIKKDRKNHV